MKNFKRSIPLPINENINTIAFDGIVGRQFSIISKTTGANVNFDKSAKVRVDDIDDALTLISNLSDNGSEEFIINYSQEVEDYNNIIEFCDELEACAPDYQYGESVIHEDYFTEYSTDLVKDCGYIPNELPDFIENNIDWDGVAEELKVDYTTVEYEGSTYHIR